MVLARERIYVLLSAPALNSIPYYSWLRKYFPVCTLLNSSPITGMSVFIFHCIIPKIVRTYDLLYVMEGQRAMEKNISLIVSIL